MYSLGKKSLSRLVGVNPKLSALVMRAIEISECDFTVFEGVRTLQRQKNLVRDGRSWTLKSNHLTGNAVDLVVWKDGRAQWDNVPEEYKEINRAMKHASVELGIKVDNGQDLWGKDAAHWQLPKEERFGYNVDLFLEEGLIKRIVRRK